MPILRKTSVHPFSTQILGITLYQYMTYVYMYMYMYNQQRETLHMEYYRLLVVA